MEIILLLALIVAGYLLYDNIMWRRERETLLNKLDSSNLKIIELMGGLDVRRFEIVKEDFRKVKGDEIQLPKRADTKSAGYDFYSPIDFTIMPGQTVIVPMDVKAKMERDEVLLLYVRSSIGIKKHIVLANGTGVIDAKIA